MAKRKQVKNACIHCQRACKKCDEQRPCGRCIKYNLESTCFDSPRKERRSKRNSANSSSGSSGPARRRNAITVSDEDDNDPTEDDQDDTTTTTSKTAMRTRATRQPRRMLPNNCNLSQTAISRISDATLALIRERVAQAIGKTHLLTPDVIRATYPIGVLAAVCSELVEKPIDAVHWLYERSQSPISTTEPNGFETVHFPPPPSYMHHQHQSVPQRFPTPPDTPSNHPIPHQQSYPQPYHQLPHPHQYQQQLPQHYYPVYQGVPNGNGNGGMYQFHQSLPHAPIKVSPQLIAALAQNAQHRSRSVSPLQQTPVTIPSPLNSEGEDSKEPREHTSYVPDSSVNQ